MVTLNNNTTLANYTPDIGIHAGTQGQIGRAIMHVPDLQPQVWGRFIQDPLTYGNAVLDGITSEPVDEDYSADASSDTKWKAQKLSITTSVASKFEKRKVIYKIYDDDIRQHVQTPDMIGGIEDAMLAQMGNRMNDMLYADGKSYFSGTTRGAKTTQQVVMTSAFNTSSDTFAEELTKDILTTLYQDFADKSNAYNSAGNNTLTNPENATLILRRDLDYSLFRKYLANTYNPNFLEFQKTNLEWINAFNKPTDAPSDAGDLLGMIVDNRAFSIVPAQENGRVASERIEQQDCTVYTGTYSYLWKHSPLWNVKYIYAKSA